MQTEDACKISIGYSINKVKHCKAVKEKFTPAIYSCHVYIIECVTSV